MQVSLADPERSAAGERLGGICADPQLGPEGREGLWCPPAFWFRAAEGLFKCS